ncbi:CPBP family glutamic-type intramembrane protease [Thermocrinis sp.]
MKKYGNITVSLLFVPPHFILYQNLPSLLTFFPSLAFGYVYIKTRSISLTAFVHFFSNVLYFFLSKSLSFMGFSM